uniref:Uncharacterized protein n=1 Tax=Tanacetum cinerariifolium TaxID=118510 RepID=A0A6L2J149_TANCI|nr:hypothetical protein [Tanacetum cinerariifolium]
MWKDDLGRLSSSLGYSTLTSTSLGPSTRPSYSLGPSRSALNLRKAEYLNFKFLTKKVKTLEEKDKDTRGNTKDGKCNKLYRRKNIINRGVTEAGRLSGVVGPCVRKGNTTTPIIGGYVVGLHIPSGNTATIDRGGGVVGLVTTAGTRVKTVSESYYCQYKEVTTAQVEVSVAQELKKNTKCLILLVEVKTIQVVEGVTTVMPITSVADKAKKTRDKFVVKPSVENKTSEEETKEVRKNTNALIIKEWVSDDKEENVTQPKILNKIVRPSIVKKEFVKPRQQEKTARKTFKKVENNRQNTHRPRGNQRN